MSLILLTGGAGYIGSHMLRLLLEQGREAVIFDNFSTGSRERLPAGVEFVEGDLRSPEDVKKLFSRYRFDAVLHFAASIVVPESVAEPLKYYENNVWGSVNLLRHCLKYGTRKFIFSSTAAVYGQPEQMPVSEDAPLRPENPYGRSKLMVEQILSDCAFAGQIDHLALRYFNVSGAHSSGEIGQSAHEATHLIPNILKAASGDIPVLNIFGNDYPTRDGTCVRDYIHVTDLVRAHLLALDALDKGVRNTSINLGSGCGYSVKEMVAAAEKVTGRKIPLNIAGRRPGDPAELVASYAKAKELLGWQPELGLEEIISSAWRWQQKNPRDEA
ncbi:MAG: UDP-glucose 4-epimerase GalE [Candidatus Omnitrophota bacterium]|jgi:UDP-glucose 4-epimerase